MSFLCFSDVVADKESPGSCGSFCKQLAASFSFMSGDFQAGSEQDEFPRLSSVLPTRSAERRRAGEWFLTMGDAALGFQA